jgi:hypothetical protein
MQRLLTFFSYYAHLSSVLLLTQTLTGLALAGSIALNLWFFWGGVPVYFVPPGGPGIVRPGVIPDEAAQDLASRWLQARYGYTHETIDLVQAQGKALLHPSMHADYESKTASEKKLVKEKQVTSLITIHDSVVTDRGDGTRLVVRLRAVRTVLLGGVQLPSEVLQPQITVIPYVVRGTVTGLGISAIQEMPSLSTTPRS